MLTVGYSLKFIEMTIDNMLFGFYHVLFAVHFVFNMDSLASAQSIVLVGCYYDASDIIRRDLPNRRMTSEGRATTCVQICRREGFLYAGCSNGYDCWCGDKYGSYGKANHLCYVVADNEPEFQCGSSSETVNSIYHTRFGLQMVRVWDSKNFSKGCFEDNELNPVFEMHEDFDDYKPDTEEFLTSFRCLELCNNRLYTHSSVTDIDVCRCKTFNWPANTEPWGVHGRATEEFDKYGYPTCRLPCVGDLTEPCGSPLRFIVSYGYYAVGCFSLAETTLAGFWWLKPGSSTIYKAWHKSDTEPYSAFQCVAQCTEYGLKVGREYRTFKEGALCMGKCYCSDMFPRSISAECNVPCTAEFEMNAWCGGVSDVFVVMRSSSVYDCNPDSCHLNGRCVDEINSFRCICNDGFTGKYCNQSEHMVDVPESQRTMCSPGSCQNGGTCLHKPDFSDTNEFMYLCICLPGFDDYDCSSDIDECLNSSVCPNNSQCFNTFGGFTCRCDVGFTADNSSFCEDIDECLNSSVCPNNSQCFNMFGGFTCRCDVGFTADNSSVCEDINECLERNGDCDLMARCTNFPGGYWCDCLPGYEGAGDICNDIDECSVTPSVCSSQHLCVNTDGSFKCVYHAGYNSKNNLIPAELRNECADDTDCDEFADCTSSPSGRTCSCRPGFTGNGFICDDIDECELQESLLVRCDPHIATCRNTEGSYLCTCITGYYGDGHVCQDINECWAYPCAPGSSCRNLPGTFHCSRPLPFGYIDDGPIKRVQARVDADLCATTLTNCHQNASCVNVPDSFTCVCLPGFVGDGVISCKEVDECTSDPCRNDGVCVNLIGAYRCICPKGYMGVNCEYGPRVCDVKELLHKCVRMFYLHVNLETYVVTAPCRWFVKMCTQPIDAISRCLDEFQCAVPLQIRGVIQAVNYFCRSTDNGNYSEHCKCIPATEKDIDCIGIYPHILPLADYWKINSSHPYFRNLSNPKTDFEVMKFGYSEHLSVVRSMQCRRTRVAAACGQIAADWLLRFSIILSRITPRFVDTFYHPDGFRAVSVIDCGYYSHSVYYDRDTGRLCSAINLCTPVFDIMTDNIQYGVLRFTMSDLRDVCSLSPMEYEDICALVVTRHLSLVDSYIYYGSVVVHSEICNQRQHSDYLKHQMCLRLVSSSPLLVKCSQQLSNDFLNISRAPVIPGNFEKGSVLSCLGCLRYLRCMKTILKDHCGIETAEWQHNLTRRMMVATSVDSSCLLDDDSDTTSEDAKKASKADHLLTFHKLSILVCILTVCLV